MFFNGFKSKKRSNAKFVDILEGLTIELESLAHGNKVLSLGRAAMSKLTVNVELVASFARDQEYRVLAARAETLQCLLEEATAESGEDHHPFHLVQAFRTFSVEARTVLRRIQDEAAGPRNPETGEKFDILIIDDDAIELKIVARTLEPDCNVSLAMTPMEAVKVLKRCRPDLILLDVDLGALSGNEFLDLIKDSRSYRDIPILMRSNMVDDETVVTGLARGALDFLSKDLSASDLRRRAFEVLTTGRARQYA